MSLRNLMPTLCAFINSIVIVSHAANITTLSDVSSGEIELGEWNTNFAVAKSYAEANGIPLFAFYSNPGCGQCNRLKTACNTPQFVAWRKAKKILMVFSEGGTAVKDFTRNASGKYPYLRLYWPAGNVDKKFSGRSSTIPASGSTIEEKLINCLNSYLAAWGGGSAEPIVIEPPKVGPEWNKARTLFGSFYDSNGVLAGRIQVTAGKASSGKARIKAAIMGLDGKQKNLQQKIFTIDTTTRGVLSNSKCVYNFAITNSDISGTVTIGKTIYSVSNLRTGGTLSNGTLSFMSIDLPTTFQDYPILAAYLPTPQTFVSTASKWSFARAGTPRYDRATGAFVMSSTTNPSGLKLVYKSNTGYFSGKFYVYALRTQTSVKKYTAKVTGFMVGDSGEGVVTINKVGTFACTITR